MKLLLFPILFLLASCHRDPATGSQLTSMQIIDRNGFTETITAPDRLKLLQQNNFSNPQPYKKVTRTLQKSNHGKIPSIVTTYHANGQLWQYLEVLDGRAYGLYKEFFPSGEPRLEAHVIEGEGDLRPSSQDDWIFDGINRAWDEKGYLEAEIAYKKGFLEGPSIYYHPNGKVRSHFLYCQGLIEDTVSHYNDRGKLIGTESYLKGILHGLTQFQGDMLSPPYRETYDHGKLVNALYFDLKGNSLAEIRDGKGIKALYQDGCLKKFIEYRQGYPEGKVQIFDTAGNLASEYSLQNGKKHGEEWVYNEKGRPKMMVSWYADEIHGPVKTWFSHGGLESQRDMCHNERHGHSFAWYTDESLMLVETYENGLLVKGSYMKKGSKAPTSIVENGKGFAVLHDANGYFLKKIEYEKGRPVN